MALKKQVVEGVNVCEAAEARIRDAFRRFDHVSVSFSGGKDSTAVLNLTLKIARELGRLPLDVYHFDEEAIHPPTIEYIARVAKNPDIRFLWYCIPVKHRNACSRKQPWWYCWNPKEKHLWVRDLPEGAVTYLKGFRIGMAVSDCQPLLYTDVPGTKITLLGIRTEESLRRYRVVTNRVEDNWMSLRGGKTGYRGFPIYDWSSMDVWIAAKKFAWDYNQTYDILMRFGLSPSQQRVCPPFGEEPLRGLHLYKSCFPAMWAKMVNRVHGVNTAMLYGNTDLYSVALEETPAGMTWRDYLYLNMDLYPKADREELKRTVAALVTMHYKKSTRPLHDEDPCPISGINWKFLCKIVIRGDFKGRVQGISTREAENARKRMGITLDYAVETWGTEKFKHEYFNL